MYKFTLMILAAGFGTRMNSLTKKIPKPLLKINNTTFLTNTINFFEKLGCDKFIINTHYLHDKIKNYIKLNHFNKNIKLIYEPEILNTGGALKNSLNYFESKNFLVTNSDVFWDKSNIKDVNDFISNINIYESYHLLLVKKKNIIGIENLSGDFAFQNNYIRRWVKGDPIIYYSGLQILNPKIISNFNQTKFSVNKIWDHLISKRKLKAQIMKSNLLHIGDIKTYYKIST